MSNNRKVYLCLSHTGKPQSMNFNKFGSPIKPYYTQIDRLQCSCILLNTLIHIVIDRTINSNFEKN